MRNDSIKILQLLNEGLNLTAFMVYKPTGKPQMIQDSDYFSKKDFARDLRANDFIVRRIADNRDLYVLDHSDFVSLTQLKEKMLFYKKMWEDAKKDNPNSTLWKDDYERLKEVYDEANKVEL